MGESFSLVVRESVPMHYHDRLCTDLARAAIRGAFHDCATWSVNVPVTSPSSGGCDGSLFLVPAEIFRGENGGLGPYKDFIVNFYNDPKNAYYKQVSMADLVIFAANHAIVTCPGGPVVKTWVGREDNSQLESTTGLMPAAFGPGSDAATLIKLFGDKNFSPEDLAALVGAHTTSKAFAQDALTSGIAQDSTPGVWDVKYYSETYNPPSNVGVFDSDVNLAQVNATTGPYFKGFVNDQGKWASKFSDAMFRMTLLGIPSDVSKNFADCTNYLPKASNVPTRGFTARSSRR